MSKKVIITVDANGYKFEVDGVKGDSCTPLLSDIMDRFGDLQIQSEQLKPEYYEEASIHTQTEN